MTRRTFLQIIASAPAAYVIDPEKLLWVPRTDRIFVPAIPKTQLAQMGCTLRNIIDIELKYVLPHIQTKFGKDDIFLEYLKEANMVKRVNS